MATLLEEPAGSRVGGAVMFLCAAMLPTPLAYILLSVTWAAIARAAAELLSRKPVNAFPCVPACFLVCLWAAAIGGRGAQRWMTALQFPIAASVSMQAVPALRWQAMAGICHIPVEWLHGVVPVLAAAVTLVSMQWLWLPLAVIGTELMLRSPPPMPLRPERFSVCVKKAQQLFGPTLPAIWIASIVLPVILARYLHGVGLVVVAVVAIGYGALYAIVCMAPWQANEAPAVIVIKGLAAVGLVVLSCVFRPICVLAWFAAMTTSYVQTRIGRSLPRPWRRNSDLAWTLPAAAAALTLGLVEWLAFPLVYVSAFLACEVARVWLTGRGFSEAALAPLVRWFGPAQVGFVLIAVPRTAMTLAAVVVVAILFAVVGFALPTCESAKQDDEMVRG